MVSWDELSELHALYLKGDPRAARSLFLGLTRVCRGYFHARLGATPDTEDLVQTTLLKIHFARDRFDPERSLKTWVFTVASRSLIDHWRGKAAENEVFEAENGGAQPQEAGDPSPLEEHPDHCLDPEQKVSLHQDLNRALAGLKPTERSIVYLYGVEGLSMAEIGEALSMSEGAVKVRAHRAYRELRARLEA